MKRLKAVKGVTLIELIIAMAIFSIILVAFLSMFSSAMISVINAGNRSKAIGQTQLSVEQQYALNDPGALDQISITFNGVDVVIPGRNISESKTSGQSESTLKGFIPKFPSITLDKVATSEGASRPMIINVTGINTNFNSSTKVYVRDMTRSIIFLYDDFIESTDASLTKTKGYFEVDSDWLNYHGDYIVTLTTTLTGRVEVVHAKHTVALPKLVAVGQNKVFVSEDGSRWFERSAVTTPAFPTVGVLNSVVHHDQSYVALGDSGNNLSVITNENWVKHTNSITDHFVDIHNESKSLVAVTSNGKIYQSTTGNFDSAPIYTDTVGTVYNGVTMNRDGNVIAVGSKIVARTSTGVVTSTVTGETMNAVHVKSTYNETTGLWTHEYLAVGNNGTIRRSTDNGVTWTPITSGTTSHLYDVTYYNNNWVIVGANGTMLRSTTGDSSTWLSLASGTAQSLRSVIGAQGRIFAVGDNSTIVRSGENNYTFTATVVPNGVNFKSISGR